jgi:hypothetical protein
MSDLKIEGKIISSLEKVLIDADATLTESYSHLLKNEQLNFQLVYKNNGKNALKRNYLKIDGDLAEYVVLRIVENVPVEFMPADSDDYYISQQSGVYPDRLMPIGKLGIVLSPHKQKAVWVSIVGKNGLPSGIHKLTFSLYSEKDELLSTLYYTVDVLDAESVKNDLKLTTWMHYDCICQQHNVKPFTKKFYQIFTEYLKAYTHIGMNMLLTPIFTPPLDTDIGGERMTIQLVDVYYEKETYRFDFTKLGYFIRFVKKRGIEYIEFSHLFTQWGGHFCPKIMVHTEEGYKNLFGWNVSQSDARYVAFLSAFLPALYDYTKKLGVVDKCYYHLTDEPSEKVIDNYEKARNLVKKHIGDCKIMDAMSHYDFYQNGFVDIPVCYTEKFGEFDGKDVEELFSYYCCFPAVENYSNRFINMPALRTRIIGTQLYETGVHGFLHWGFNFYNSILSIVPINPYVVTDIGGCYPAGDGFIVYPSSDGVVLSIRAEILKEAIQDYELLKTLEFVAGKEETRNLLAKYRIKGYNIYPHDERAFITFKEEIYQKINENCK